MPEGSLVFFAVFKPFAGLLCAVSTRQGGFSQGCYTGLNLGLNSGDQGSAVRKNRDYFFSRLGISEEQTALGQQIHSANVRLVSRGGSYGQTDALITQEKNVFLTVQVADCFPVFLFEPSSATVAVIHAGWRGTSAGIIENTLERLKAELNIPAAGLIAAIGPGLQKECFEVGADVYELFEAEYSSSHEQADKRYLDLRRVIADKLVRQGINRERMEWSLECTRCSAEKYFSYRRDGKNSGRMIGVIGMRREIL
jgi:YfiH family protein